MTTSLILSASVVVLLGLCWQLGALASAASNGTPATWWHVLTTAVLCAAAGLIVYRFGMMGRNGDNPISG
jgi:hypothetical protein